MKRELVSIVAILFFITSCNLSIKVEKKFPNGNIESVGYLRNNKKNGKAQSFYINGVLKEEGEWVDDKQEGVWNYYRDDGSLSAIVNFKNDTQDGVSTFYNPNKLVNEESVFVAGLLNGVTKKYYDNGRLKEVSNWLSGKREGVTIIYDSATLNETKLNYSKGVLRSPN